MTAIVTLHAHRFRGTARLWALGQMGAARLPLMRTPGLEFWKLCGAGSGAGFRPAPDLGVAVILASWASPEAAAAGLRRAPWKRWADRAAERCALAMRPVTSRGAWSGRAPFEPGGTAEGQHPADDGTASMQATDDPARATDAAGSGPPEQAAGPAPRPIAALTRASIRPAAAARFWRRVPRLDGLIGENAEVLFRLGIGELPLVRQGTFTVWPSEAAMARYARTGPHAEAIAMVRAGGVFSEDLYARFEVLAAEGSWAGRPPLGGGAPSLAEALCPGGEAAWPSSRTRPISGA